MTHVDVAIVAEGRAVVENEPGAVLVFSRSWPYRSISFHFSSIPGSRLGRPAFMGKAVFGVIMVFFCSPWWVSSKIKYRI